MRIKRLKVENYGPLNDLDWQLPEVGVVYDDNMAGKTALVDVMVRHLFIPREGSSLFRNYQRFSGGDSEEVSLEVEDSGTSYSFGAGENDVQLKELFGWTEEGLFRLLCIRAGDNRLVTGSRERSSIFNAAASLVAGVGTEKLDRIDSDLQQEFRITRRNNWSNRKTTQPPKVKERIEDEILPFLNDFSTAEQDLHRFKEKKYEVDELERELEELEGRKDELERKLGLIRAKELEKHLMQIEGLKEKLEKYERISREDEEAWRGAKEKLERNRQNLSKEDFRGDRPEEKLKAITEEIEAKEELLEDRIEKKIDSKREKEARLKERVREIVGTAKEKRREASRFLKREIRDPLQELTQLEEERLKLRFWAINRTWIGTTSGILVIVGGLVALLFAWPAGIFSLVGLGFLLISLRRSAKHRRLSEEIEKLKREITGSFNSKFGSLFDWNIRDTKDVREAIEEVPGRVEEVAKQERDFSDLMDQKRRTKVELEEFKEKRDSLPEKIEKLKSDRDNLKKRISDAKRKAKEARRELADLRDRTNLPDLAGLEEELEKKAELKRRIREERAVLKSKLRANGREDSKLTSRAEKRIHELRKEEGGTEVDLSGGPTDLTEEREKLSRELEELKAKTDRKQEKLRKKREELQRLMTDLSRIGVDPGKPAEFFRRKLKLEKELEEFIKDRISGGVAREVLKNVGTSYLENLNRFISGDSVKRTVEDLFTEVMGGRFEVEFDRQTKEFVIKEDGLSYPESDLSSGGRKHLFLSVRLALVNRITSEPGFLVLDDPFLFYQRDRKRKAISQLRPFIEEGWQILFFTVDNQTRDGAVEELEAVELAVEDLEV